MWEEEDGGGGGDEIMKRKLSAGCKEPHPLFLLVAHDTGNATQRHADRLLVFKPPYLLFQLYLGGWR